MEAPAEALEILKSRPETAPQFQNKFGYLPEGVELPPAPEAALKILEENPTTAPQFKKKFGYVPAPEAAINVLREQPNTAAQFRAKFGYLPKLDPTTGERLEAGVKDLTTGLLRLARNIPTAAIEFASRAQQKRMVPATSVVDASGKYIQIPAHMVDEHNGLERALPEQALPKIQHAAEEVESALDGTIEQIKLSLPEAVKAARSGPIVTKDKDGKVDVHWENINIDVLSQLAAESIAYGGGVFKLAQVAGGGAVAAGAANSTLISAETVHDTRQKILAKLEKQGIRGDEAQILANQATARAVEIIAPVAFVTGKFGEGAAIRSSSLRQVPSAVGKGAAGEAVEEVIQQAAPDIATDSPIKNEELLAAGILAPIAGGMQSGTISAAAAWEAQLKESLAKETTEALDASVRENNDRAQGKEVIDAERQGVAVGEERRAEPTEGPRERRQEESAEKRQETADALQQYRAVQADFEAGIAGQEDLNAAAEKALTLLYKDDLTGLDNFRAYHKYLKDHPDHAIAKLDLDGFKELNTKYGHDGADGILKAVGAVISKVAKENNVVAFRISTSGKGDEFAIMGADPALLKTVGKRVQDELESTTLEVINQKGEKVNHPSIGVSYGVASNKDAAETALEADKAARKASGKRQGLRDNPATDAAAVASPVGEPAAGPADSGVEGQPVGSWVAADGTVVQGQPATSEEIQAARPNLPAEERPSTTAYAGAPLDRAGEIIVNATRKLMDALGIAKEGVEVVKEDPETKPGPMSLIWSPSKLVQKYPKLKKYVTWARELAFEIQEGLRNAFRNRLKKIDDVLKEGDIFGSLSDVYRQNKRTLKEIRLTEDLLGKRLTAQQMKDDFNARPAVIKAHMLMRATYDHAWTILSKTRELRGKLPPSFREGYLPHMFHNFFVIQEHPLAPGQAGPPHSEIVGSGRTMAEAIAIGNQLKRFGGKGNIQIKQKQFKFPGEDVQAATVGDIEYFQMQRKLEQDFTFTIDEATEIMDALARRKGRSRFFGNLLERKGVKGWEQDLDWVDRRYFNMVARYAALDRFKKKAIDAYERDGFGKFEAGDKKGLAAYVKDYINDINGTPTYIEDMMNNGIADTWLGKFLGHYLGDRPILQLANGTANAVAIAKLGFLSPAAALVNASQLIGSYALLGEKYFMLGNGLAMKAISGKGKGASTLRGILKQAGVDVDLGLESAAGYSSNAPLGKALNMTMIGFTSMEKYVRATTVLGAYRKALSGGSSHQEAIEFAKGINRRVNFDYSIVDTPNFIRRSGPLGTVLFQFKKFPVKSLELMLSMKGAELARFWIPVFLVAGIYAFPGGEALKELIKAMTSKNGYGGFDAELELKGWLANWAADDPEKQKWAKVAMSGVFSLEPIGVDISKRVGGSDFIPSRPSDFVGAGPSSLWRAVQFMKQGEWGEALRAVATSPGNLLIALTQGKFSTSATDRDRPIAEVTPGDVLKKAIGFRPYEESKEMDVARLIKYENEKYRALQVEVIDGIIETALEYGQTVAAAEAVPPSQRKQIIAEAEEKRKAEMADIMETMKNHALVITEEQVENEIKNKNLTRSQRAFLNASEMIKARTSKIYRFAQGSDNAKE